MPKVSARSGIWAAVVLVTALLIGIFVGLPFIASTQIVRDRIAHQLTAWSGFRISINEGPDVRVWPTFRAVLKDVRLQEWGDTGSEPVLEAEQIEIDLSALSALRGDVVFTRMRLVRPTLRIRNNLDITQIPSSESWGRLVRSVNAAKAAVAASPEQPDLSTLPSDSLGDIDFVDARIVRSADAASADVVTSLSGTLNWPALNRPASLTAKGIWRGESFAMKASSSQPLLLLGGGNAPVSLTLETAPAVISFEGVTTLTGQGPIDGNLNLSVPSLNRLVEWTRGSRLPGPRIGPLTIEAHLSGDSSRLKFDTSNLTIDSSTGRGLLEIGFGLERPSVTGTLAFNTLNLRGLVSALGPLDLNGGAPDQVSMPIMSQGFDFDLRFSADTARFGAITLNKLAAAAKATNQLSSFDISDATGLGGNFQVGIRSDRTSNQELVELRFNGTDIELGSLAASFGREHLIPQGKANLSVVLRGSGSNIGDLLSTANGEVSALFGPGRLPGIDFEDLLKKAASGEFVALDSRNSRGNVALDGMELRATLKNGLAQIDTAKASAGRYTLELEGLVPVAGRALALFAILTDNDKQEEELHFFVGGSWDAPFITSPVRILPNVSGD